MHTLRRWVAGLILCSTAAVAPPLHAQGVTPRYHWTQGEEFRYRLTLQTTTTISGAGLPAAAANTTVDSTMTQIFRTVVDDVAADGTATLRQVIESVRMEVAAPTGTMVFDSTTNDSAALDPLSKSLSSVYSAMIGASVTVVTAPTGAIQKIEGMSRMLDKILAAQPSTPIPPGALEGLKSSFSDDAMRDMYSRGFAAFPDRPLSPGDAWDEQFTVNVPLFGAMSTARTWTFQGVESTRGGAARFTARMTMKADPSKAGAATAQPSPISMEFGENTGESEMLFDVARGRVLSVVTHLTQAMTVSMSAPSGGSGMSMRTAGKTTMLFELLDAPSR